MKQSDTDKYFPLAIVGLVAIFAVFTMMSSTTNQYHNIVTVGSATFQQAEDHQSIFSDEFIAEAYDIAYEIAYINGVDYYFELYGDLPDENAEYLRGGSTTVYYTTSSGTEVSIKRRTGSSTVTVKVNPPGWNNGMTFKIRQTSNPESLLLTGSHGVRCTATPTDDGGTYVKCNSKMCELSEKAREKLGDDCEGVIDENLLEKFEGPLRDLLPR